MNPIVKHPVFDLDNKLLVEAGTELSPEYMEDFSRGNGAHYATIAMLEYGTIHHDLNRQLFIPPYDIIFAEPNAVETVLSIMQRVSLPLPILQSMDYFKKHDFHTYRHMLMISALSSLLLSNIDPHYHELEAEELAHCGPFHDMGKYTVPLPVLLKKTPLTSAEYDLLKHHSVAGYILLSHYLKDHTSLAGTIALDHHERRNGSGYSRGIWQHNLIVEVTTVCDIYDALVSQRPYRPISYDNRTALEELTWMAQRGEIGWEAVRVLVAYNRRSSREAGEITISLDRRGKPPVQNVYGKLADQESTSKNVDLLYRDSKDIIGYRVP